MATRSMSSKLTRPSSIYMSAKPLPICPKALSPYQNQTSRALYLSIIAAVRFARTPIMPALAVSFTTLLCAGLGWGAEPALPLPAGPQPAAALARVDGPAPLSAGMSLEQQRQLALAAVQKAPA